MKQINTLGKLCPAPLILTKKGITEAAEGEVIEVITDNETAFQNLMSYLAELKITPSHKQEGTLYTITFEKPATVNEAVDAAAYCNSPQNKAYVVAIKGDTMGTGDDELGKILLRAFINSLKEVDTLPEAIVLYNSGVMVALKGTDTAASLQELEEKGVSIIACGTCLDYYDVKNQLAVGMIGNMYKITSLLANTGHVIYP
ncbi:MAG: sulfurtransferase-like selenium metabolism protein YedF [Tannerellaceae bacterium]